MHEIFRLLSEQIPDMLDKVKIKLDCLYPHLIIRLEGTWALTITSRNTSTLAIYYRSKPQEKPEKLWSNHEIRFDVEELKGA